MASIYSNRRILAENIQIESDYTHVLNAVVGNTDSSGLALGQFGDSYCMLIWLLFSSSAEQERTGPGVNNGNIVVNVNELFISSLEREEVVDLLVGLEGDWPVDQVKLYEIH